MPRRIGQLGLNQDFRHQGILGNVFTGQLVEQTTLGGSAAVVQTITGTAWISGFNTLVRNRDDPFPEGYTLGDIWP